MAEMGQGQQPQPKQQLASARFGVYNNALPLVGKTVAEARAQLQGMWQVPADATAYKGKTRLEDNYVIEAGDEIEFQRRTGEKGNE